MEDKIYDNLDDMFNAIRDENGVLHPGNYVPKPGQKFIRLWDGALGTLEELRDNPATNRVRSAGK